MVIGKTRPPALLSMLLTAAVCFSGCVTVHQKALNYYAAGDPALAETTIEPLLEDPENKDYILCLWDDGMFRFSQGNYKGAIEDWMKAGELTGVEPGALETSLELFSSDASKRFLGDPVEHSVSYLYVGLAFYMLRDYEKATIAFRKSLEWDFSTEQERQGDMVITNMLLGECYARAGEHDQAAVAYRRALTANPDCVAAGIGLCRELRAMGDDMQAKKYCDEIAAKEPEGYVASLEEDTSGILVVVMSGPAPSVEKDAYLGAFRKRVNVKTPLDHWKIECVDEKEDVDASLADDLLTHFKDQGGESGQAVRKGVQVAASAVMKEVPILGLFAPSTEADVRYWSTLPGDVFVAYLPATPGTHTICARAYDKKDRPLDNYRQIWHYIPVREGENTVVVLISHANLQHFM
jgi:tetratricopeptide (TPR) repeat protein